MLRLKYRVGVLGGTGIVGQRMISLVTSHPWFELEFVTASEKSSGRKYGDIVKWIIEKPLPDKIAGIKVEPTHIERILEYKPDIVFSALPSSIAANIEVELAREGIVVVSNASSMRMEPDIPLINPEVNADHIDIIERQQRNRGWRGYIVKVPNCSTAILTLALKPLYDEVGLKRVVVVTMQSLSGAGLKGVPSMLILDNIIPYIGGEEEKIENETLKILGKMTRSGIEKEDFSVTASCNRVMVLEGHLENVFVETMEEIEAEEASRILREFKGNKIKRYNLPSAPREPVIVRSEDDRPQPRLDRFAGNGMSVVVGRIRRDKVLNGLKLVVLGHNTIRGAAGTALLIAELLAYRNLI